jgi:MarR family 2-MHQ and catechol resistance regulon transcriptional repressor
MDELDRVFQEMGFAAKPGQLPEAGVVYALARTFNLVARELGVIYKRYGLSAPSFNLLMLLRHGKDPDEFSQQRIGSRLVVSPSDMTGLIDRLEHKGLVRRAPGRDHRSHRLQITPKGVKLLDDVWPDHCDAVRRLLKGLDRGQLQALLSGLAGLRQALDGV